MCRVANQQTTLPRATSSLALNASRDGASTASLDRDTLATVEVLRITPSLWEAQSALNLRSWYKVTE